MTLASYITLQIRYVPWYFYATDRMCWWTKLQEVLNKFDPNIYLVTYFITLYQLTDNEMDNIR